MAQQDMPVRHRSPKHNGRKYEPMKLEALVFCPNLRQMVQAVVNGKCIESNDSSDVGKYRICISGVKYIAVIHNDAQIQSGDMRIVQLPDGKISVVHHQRHHQRRQRRQRE